VRLVLVEQARPQTTVTQSECDLSDALRLVAPYTQAALLGLLWQPQPRRIYVIGLGGGRVPLVLHHYLPEAVIECSEIDPVVLRLAERYFGLRPDERLQVVIEDGREWLTRRDRRQPYDIIFLDAFLDRGYTPYRLATVEFCELCRAHLSERGVLIINLLESDPFFAARVRTVEQVFAHVNLCPVPGENCLVFAAVTPGLDREEWLEQARAAQETHGFTFPFVERAIDLAYAPTIRERLPALDQAPLLADDEPPEGYFELLPSFDSPFMRLDPELPCPCGSGRRAGDCHARGSAADSRPPGA
jgi:spermidine synthase